MTSNQLLFTIDPRPMQAALARDQAQLENAEIQFGREKKLFDQKLVSQDEYDTSKSAGIRSRRRCKRMN